MTIKYIRDAKLEYTEDISNGLVTYNKMFTGETRYESMNVYVLENDKLVGGCHTGLGWNWVFIGELFYENQEVLSLIMNELYKIYKGNVEGITIENYSSDRIEDFKQQGFDVQGVLKDMPIGFDTHVMCNKEMIGRRFKHAYVIEAMGEKHEDYTRIVDEQVEAYNKKHKIDDRKIDIQYVALDQEKIVGGVSGCLAQDYLYVSRLWVDEAYRGKDIASNLMDHIENEANEKGYRNCYLGTSTFQAKGLYEKRGYEVKMVIPNCPKGYEDFVMVKGI